MDRTEPGPTGGTGLCPVLLVSRWVGMRVAHSANRDKREKDYT